MLQRYNQNYQCQCESVPSVPISPTILNSSNEWYLHFTFRTPTANSTSEDNSSDQEFVSSEESNPNGATLSSSTPAEILHFVLRSGTKT